MKCKFEHDEDCCNCGSPQYMCKCKPSICGCVVPMTNADRIMAMSDEELAKFLNEPFCDKRRTYEECTISYCGVCDQCVLDWLQQPAEAADYE